MSKPVFREYGIGLDTAPFEKSLFDVPSLPEPLKSVFGAIEPAARVPFTGVTTQGEPVRGLFPLRATGISTEALVAAASRFLDSLPEGQRVAAVLPLDDHRRRLWSNGFMPFTPHGILLEEADAEVRSAALGLIEASFSAKGFHDARKVMQLNALLGQLIGDGRRNLTEWMYWVTIFGRPGTDETWGWQLGGHHLDLNVTVVGDQLVITPAFMGAEPRISDETEGPYADLRVFDEEELGGLTLVRALSPEQQAKAILYPSMKSSDLPELLAGALNGRHLGGAGQDNLILPYQGIPASDMDASQRDLLRQLLKTYVSRLPEGHEAVKMEEVEAHFDETHFAWIGQTELEETPFYYRVHSPVILIEFDHHPGVFLGNEEPERFHAHTIVRTPNGNDYGMDLLRQHHERFEHTRYGHVPRRSRPTGKAHAAPAGDAHHHHHDETGGHVDGGRGDEERRLPRGED